MKQLISLSESVIPYKKHINKVLMNKDKIELWMNNEIKKECDDYLTKLSANVNNVNMSKEIEHLLFRCLLRSFVGSKHMLNNSKKFQENFLFLLQNFNNTWIKLENKLGIKIPSMCQFGIRKKYSQIQLWFNQMIDQSCSELINNNGNNNECHSYLQTLIDNPLRGRESDTRHVFAMLYGATVNTIPSIMLALFLIQLPENQDILNKLLMFINKISLSRNTYNMWQFDYLDQTLNEILRLYPVRLITRVTKCKIKLGGKNNYTIPKRSWFIMSPYWIHRDASNYDSPNRFLPQRWKNEKHVREMKLSGKYMNFGFGKHSCMGRRFATMLFKTFFFQFFKNYQIKFQDNQSFQVIYHSKKRGFKNDLFGNLILMSHDPKLHMHMEPVPTPCTSIKLETSLVIIVGPSGVGKNTMINWLMKDFANKFGKG